LRFPFNRKLGLIVVEAHIAGPSRDGIALLALDTGATWSMVNRKLLQTLGYDLVGLEHRTISTASASLTTPVLTVQRLRSLGKERLDFPVLCNDLPAPLHVHGLLGLDFLRSYRLVVDFPTGAVSLR
jgi:predicted aspartyl protease